MMKVISEIDIYVFITITQSTYLLVYYYSLMVLSLISDQCFGTDKVYKIYLLLKSTVSK
jgi:hypothetical protein